MGDNLVPEKVFFDRLYKEGFKPSPWVDGELRLWVYNGEEYTIPLTIAEDSEQGYYCPRAVEEFFKHVFTADALSDPFDERSYNVTKLPRKPASNPTKA